MPNVAGVRAFIDRHYAQPLTVERLARLAGLSRFHFIRAFRATVGHTPHRYLRDQSLLTLDRTLKKRPASATAIVPNGCHTEAPRDDHQAFTGHAARE